MKELSVIRFSALSSGLWFGAPMGAVAVTPMDLKLALAAAAARLGLQKRCVSLVGQADEADAAFLLFNPYLALCCCLALMQILWGVEGGLCAAAKLGFIFSTNGKMRWQKWV